MNIPISSQTPVPARRNNRDTRHERNRTMRWTRRLTLFILLTLIVSVLAACGGAPAQPSATGVTAAPAASAIPPTVGIAPTAAPTAGIASTAPNDTTQARLRVSPCALNGPNVDLFVNGQVPMNGGMAQSNLDALGVSAYVYLTPGTYSVALVPSGKSLAQATLGPLDVPMVAGHRYTVAMLGQVGDTHHTALVIDETAAYQSVGATPTSSGHISINNIKGLSGMDIANGGVIVEQDVPYGGFKAGLWTVGFFKDLDMTVSGAANKNVGGFKGDGFNAPGSDFLDCFSGSYPGTNDTHSGPNTSTLNSIDFLQGWSSKGVKHGSSPTFDTFLAAIKTAGLTDLLTTGGPYVLFVPTDDAFAAMPKDQRDALLADPKALADVLRAHIVAGYYPPGSLARAPGAGSFDHTITNLLGAKLVLLTRDDALSINGENIGGTDAFMVANGTRVFFTSKVIMPAAK